MTVLIPFFITSFESSGSSKYVRTDLAFISTVFKLWNGTRTDANLRHSVFVFIEWDM